jgi:hypothetical protein
MNTNFYRDVDILLKRAITASIVAFVVFGGVAAWQYVSTERIAARIEQAQFYRARSASKKGTWPLPPYPSQAARCASTEDHQAPSPLCSGCKGSARVLFHPSASKKDGLAFPVSPYQPSCH